MRKQFVKTITELMEKDERLYLLLGDIGVYGFRNVLQKYPLRAQNVGVCEQSMISLAAGLALTNFIPVIHSIAPFLVERAYEQIKIDFGYQQLGGNFVSVGASNDYDKLGYTHSCPTDVSILQQIPNMQITVPGSKEEFDTLFKHCYDNSKPTYYRLSKYTNRKHIDIEFGKVKVIGGTGTKFTILAVGPALQYIIGTFNVQQERLLYTNTVMPFDVETVIENCPSGNLIIIEPYYTSLIVKEIINAKSSLNIKCIGFPKLEDISVGFNINNYIAREMMIAKQFN